MKLAIAAIAFGFALVVGCTANMIANAMDDSANRVAAASAN